MRKKEVIQLVGKISEGVLSSTIDLVLYTFSLTMSSFFKSPTSRGVYQTFTEADEAFRQLNYQTFKRAFFALKKQGFVNFPRQGPLQVEITRQGKERLAKILPCYEIKRPWDKKIYLITYDIPTKRNKDRDLLRNYLKRLGCAFLQASVWVTPYNPQKLLFDFAREKALDGVILVSDLGLDGKIGNESLKSLLSRIYQLEGLKGQYQEFLEKYSGKKTTSPLEISFAFNKILRDDPQLPFDLLPNDWPGEKAYRLFLRLLHQS